MIRIHKCSNGLPCHYYCSFLIQVNKTKQNKQKTAPHSIAFGGAQRGTAPGRRVEAARCRRLRQQRRRPGQVAKAVQRTAHCSAPAIPSALALNQRPLKNLPAIKILLAGYEEMRRGKRDRRGTCAFCVTDHYCLPFFKKFLLQIFTGQSQFPSFASSLNLKLPLPCKCTKMSQILQ